MAMSACVRADIFYGFVFDTEYPNFDLYDAIKEWNKQWVPQPPNGSFCKSPEWDEWRKLIKKWESTGPGLIEGSAGHSEGQPRSWVGLKGYKTAAYWDPEPIPEGAIRQPKPEEIEMLKAFMQKHVVGDRPIGWFLSPFYG